VPRKVHLWDPVTGSVRVVAVSGSGQDTLAIDENGDMWACGRNLNGQLGVGHTGSVFNMQRILIAPYDRRCALDEITACLAKIVKVLAGSFPQQAGTGVFALC
jgi:alpha-tubulin suppressor-like RCC1 family protein